MSEIQDRVSLTSQYMAAARAVEHKRANRLFADPLAEKLAGKEIMAEILPQVEEYEKRGRPVIAVRTRFFDDFLMSSATNIWQVVILGAGMDTRAFRLPWHSDTHLYELDCPEVVQRKESLLNSVSAKCHRDAIPIDLRQSWFEQLTDRGFQPLNPSIWLLEGLLYYLNSEEVMTILKTISDSATSDSRLGVDLLNKQMTSSNNGLAKYWQYGVDEPEQLLAKFGWQASVVQFGDEAASFGRFKHKFPSREVPGIARGFLVTAIKSD